MAPRRANIDFGTANVAVVREALGAAVPIATRYSSVAVALLGVSWGEGAQVFYQADEEAHLVPGWVLELAFLPIGMSPMGRIASEI